MKVRFLVIVILLFTTLPLISQTIYTSDSITYDYAGQENQPRIDSYLKQFGCIDQITDKTRISRNGDFIQIVTNLERNDRYKVINITVQAQTELISVQEDNITSKQYQSISGYVQGSVYYKDLDYYNPITPIESPYVTVNWIVYDYDKDGVFERLELQIINSKDIIQIFHCHILE